jgi:protein SCO1/2
MNKKHEQTLKKFFLLSALLFVALLVFKGVTDREIPVTKSAKIFQTSVAMPQFELKDHFGKPLNNEAIKGQWSMFFFGYTHCPDICPTELLTLSYAMQEMQKQQPDIKLPQVYFVSVDPNRDTLELLKGYTGHFHETFVGTTGEQKELDKLTEKLNVIYEKVYHLNGRQIVLEKGDEIPEVAKDSYLINHSVNVFVTNPEGDWYSTFSPPLEGDLIAKDMLTMINAW